MSKSKHLLAAAALAAVLGATGCGVVAEQEPAAGSSSGSQAAASSASGSSSALGVDVGSVVVQRGESWDELAQRVGVPADELAKHNGLSRGNDPVPGTRLRTDVPSPTQSASSERAGQSQAPAPTASTASPAPSSSSEPPAAATAAQSTRAPASAVPSQAAEPSDVPSATGAAVVPEQATDDQRAEAEQAEREVQQAEESSVDPADAEQEAANQAAAEAGATGPAQVTATPEPPSAAPEASSSVLDERRARIVARSYSDAVGGATEDELVELLVSGYRGRFDRAVAEKVAQEMGR